MHAEKTAATPIEEPLKPEEIDRVSALQVRLDELLVGLQKSDIAEYTEMYRHPWRLFWMNIWMGIGRGIGYLLGFAIGGTLLVYILNQIVDINLPLIGDFIAQVVEIVQHQLGQNAIQGQP